MNIESRVKKLEANRVIDQMPHRKVMLLFRNDGRFTSQGLTQKDGESMEAFQRRVVPDKEPEEVFWINILPLGKG